MLNLHGGVSPTTTKESLDDTQPTIPYAKNLFVFEMDIRQFVTHLNFLLKLQRGVDENDLEQIEYFITNLKQFICELEEVVSEFPYAKELLKFLEVLENKFIALNLLIRSKGSYTAMVIELTNMLNINTVRMTIFGEFKEA